MGYGYQGRILHVDLNNRKIEVEEKPENLLILATGAMTGSPY